MGTIAALANVSEGEVRAFLKAARARGAAPPDAAAQPLGAEAVQRNGSQASAGAAPLEAPGPDWTPQVLQLRWPTG